MKMRFLSLGREPIKMGLIALSGFLLMATWASMGEDPTSTPAVLAAASSPGVSQGSEGQRLLKELVEAARKEGKLDWFGVSSLRKSGARKMAEAFNRRFGLNIKVNANVSGGTVPAFSKAVLETRARVRPTYDVMQGVDHHALEMADVGGSRYIDKWEIILREISPEAYRVRHKISPADVAGQSFQYGNRLKAVLYNTEKISREDLPKTWAEMGDPKYRGKYSVPPWVADSLYGILKYPKDGWYETVKRNSAWGVPVLKYRGALKRMLLGEFAFFHANAYMYFQTKAKDPKAPIGLSFFRDFEPLSYTFMVVRKGAKHPNAAALFALWSATPEANRIYSDRIFLPNYTLGTDPIAKQVMKVVRKQGVELVSWWESPETVKKFRWYNTDEGKAYSQRLAKALTGRAGK